MQSRMTQQASQIERVIMGLGWFHVLFLIVVLVSPWRLLFYFSAMQWGAIVQALPEKISGVEPLSIQPLAEKTIFLISMGTGYVLYQGVIITLFAFSVKRNFRIGASIFAFISATMLILFTAVGINGEWT